MFRTDIVGTCVNLHATAHAVVDDGDWIALTIKIASGRGGGRQLIVSSRMLVARRFAQVGSFESKVGKLLDAVLTTTNRSSGALQNCIQ